MSLSIQVNHFIEIFFDKIVQCNGKPSLCGHDGRSKLFNSQCWSSLPDRKVAGITSSRDLILLVSFEFTFNFLLTIVSLILLFVIPRGSTISFLGWLYSFLFLGFAVSVTDIVAMSTFSADKNTLDGTPTSTLVSLTNMLLLVSVIASRGVVYWVLNISILFYIFMSATMRLFKACRKLDEDRSKMNGNLNAAYEEDERGLPAHTAVSRWPGVGRSLWRNYKFNHREPARDHWSQESTRRDRAAFGAREELKQRPSFRDAFSYTEPRRSREWDGDPRGSPGPSRPQPKPQGDRRGSGPTRPNSLQEAILTIKPLRQVRPKIPDMQNRY
ncbi:unnamed protein product [Nezara viridula]|uniref:Uncharacterized protein n=1 Tax=Nezara viridula TaxID=85310 RepID=A0A9P0GZY7_NEZVI|nr:unnamed protein product [Nezara viridula]